MPVGGQVEGVVRDQNSPDAFGKRTELLFHPQNLSPFDASAFNRHAARGVDAGDGDFTVQIKGLKVIRDISPVQVESPEPGIEVVERNVMIPRHHDLRRGKRAQKGGGGLEFAGFRALRQVARDNHKVRPDSPHGIDELLHDYGFRPAEVDIGNVYEGSYEPSLVGTITRKAAGRVR